MGTVTYVFDRICQYSGCGKELFGRSDKKYCNDECRNLANSANRKKEFCSEERDNPIWLALYTKSLIN